MFRNYKKLADTELLTLIAQNSHPAFDELYNRYSGKLYHYFIRLCGNESVSQDLLQDLFMRVVTKTEQYKKSWAVSTWLYAIAYHLFINRIRREGKMQNYDPTVLDNLTQPGERRQDIHAQLDARMLHQAIYELLNNEDDAKRQTFILRFEHDLRLQQIADIMKCPLGTVKSRLHYILSMLNKKLQTHHQDSL